MGQVLGVRCKQCGYHFEATVGHGRMECGFFETSSVTNKPVFYNYIDDKVILSEIEHILAAKIGVQEDKETYSGRTEWRGHGSAQYYCSECKHIEDHFYFRLIFEGGAYEPSYHCTKCKGILLLIHFEEYEEGVYKIISEDGKVKWHCPLCDHDKVLFENNLFFD